MATLPELRTKLSIIAKELNFVIREMKRRKPLKRAKRESVRITPDLKKKIRKFSDIHFEYSQLRIAKHFGVNPGRVSEILRGKRK